MKNEKKPTRAPESAAASQALQEDRTFDIPDSRRLRRTEAYVDLHAGIKKGGVGKYERS